MVDVIIALAPAMAAAGFFFRMRAVILIPVCVISSVVTEWVCNVILKKANPLESLGDFSAVVTGIVLALSLPPALPVWAAVIGSAFSILQSGDGRPDVSDGVFRDADDDLDGPGGD
jgi:electron transport complex protein RnfD